MSKPQGLIRRGNVWWYRRRVPLDLLKAFGGKRELKESLRTEKLDEAKARRNLVAAKFDVIFDGARSGPTGAAPHSLPEKPIGGHALPAIRNYVTREDARRADTFLSVDWATQPEKTANALRTGNALIQSLRDPSDDLTVEEILNAAETTFGTRNLTTEVRDNWSLLHRAVLELARRDLARMKGDYQQATFDHLFGDQILQPAPVSFQTNAITLGQVVEHYRDDYAKTKSGVRQKRREKLSAAYVLILAFFGNQTSVAQIDRKQCREFRNLLNELPANRSKHFPDGAHELTAIATEAAKRGLPNMARDTQETYLATLRRLLTWAEKEGHIARNPAADLTALGEKTPSKEARDPFSAAQLTRIFSAPLYRGCKNDKEGYSIPGPNIVRGTRFWIPLLGLYTGMRLNEICQLDVADVCQSEKDTWFIAVDDGADDKNIKNQFSKREIPVHTDLVKMGFLDFVKGQSKLSSKLFSDLRRSERGYHSERMSRWFNEGLLRTAGAKTATTSFHSFRHSFRDALRSINAPGDVVQGLGGWRMEEGESARYGSGLRADKLAPWLGRIEYEGLDLSHLYLSIGR